MYLRGLLSVSEPSLPSVFRLSVPACDSFLLVTDPSGVMVPTGLFKVNGYRDKGGAAFVRPAGGFTKPVIPVNVPCISLMSPPGRVPSSGPQRASGLFGGFRGLK